MSSSLSIIITRFAVFLAAWALLLSATHHAAEPAKDAKEKEKSKPNRLAKESSPYLLQHAYNPVDWFAWGPEAFEKAKKEKKLVFLSIGYSSCHWCHVMEKESFADKDVAAYLNEHFVCIKVDREERPDIDDIYMNALHVMGARGGWPLSMFLTADAKPIVGGTYWPREDKKVDDETLVGFKTVLKKMLDVWKNKPKEIQEQADEHAEQTSAALERGIRANPILDLDRALANGYAESVREDIDPTYGGIGSKARRFQGTKFPMPTAISALLDQAIRAKDDDLKKQIKLTLDQMLMGGIYDQLGGGFHRYSTERTWTVPHFEKMLYDNGQLMELYAEAYRHMKDPNYARIIRETLAWIQREMTSRDGVFYSALDADSNGVEGEFYVWTTEQLEKAGEKGDIALMRRVYGATGAPNFEEKFHILRLSKPLEEIAKDERVTVERLSNRLDTLKKRWFNNRARRERPFLDTKVLTSWNGQMIAGYAKAGEVLKEPEYIKAATKAADFVLKNLKNKDGRLLRTWSIKADGKPEAKFNAYLDDYAFLAHGLLNLYDATSDKKWLDEARSLMEVVVKWHADGDRGGYFFTSSDHEKLFARPKDFYDGAQPSANGVVARNLVRLWQTTKDESYRKLAEKSMRQFAGIMRTNPSSVPNLCSTLHQYLDVKEAAAEKKEPKGEAPKSPVGAGPLKSEDVVKLSATAGKVDNGKQTIEIKLAIEKPWHIYANPSGSDATAGNQTTVSIRIGGKPVEAVIEYLTGELVEDKEVGNYRIYEKETVIKALLEGQGGGEVALEVWVKIQACTKGPNGRCMAPATLKTTPK
jgi:uncharacterized protein